MSDFPGVAWVRSSVQPGPGDPVWLRSSPYLKTTSSLLATASILKDTPDAVSQSMFAGASVTALPSISNGEDSAPGKNQASQSASASQWA